MASLRPSARVREGSALWLISGACQEPSHNYLLFFSKVIPSFQFLKKSFIDTSYEKSDFHLEQSKELLFCLRSVPTVADEFKRVEKKEHPENRKI